MATVYSEIPHNYDEIEDYAVADIATVKEKIITSEKVFFYDACSFRYHSNLPQNEKYNLTDYFKSQRAIIVITRCIMMELASSSGTMNPEYIDYMKSLSDRGIIVVLLKEEDMFSILSVCFSTNEAVNSYLSWAVRMMNDPVSTIKETLESDTVLYSDLVKGRNLAGSDLYERFFKSVRGNKESGDNLGEELLAICMQVLTHLPGTGDGKYCVLTDDKGAVGKISSLLNKTNVQHGGAKVILYSTPKLIQTMYTLGFELDKASIVTMLSSVTNSNIIVIGTTEYDLEIDSNISLSADELAEMIMTPNKISILF